MKAICYILNFAIVSRISNAFFDIEELKTFNYGINIRPEPVAMKTEVCYCLEILSS